MALAPITILPIGTGVFIVREAQGYFSREVLTIASGSGKLVPGTVLGIITANSKAVPYAPGAADGSQNAAAILFEECDATSADVKRTCIVRDCEVQKAMLAFAGAPTQPQKDAAFASLAAAPRVIVCR